MIPLVGELRLLIEERKLPRLIGVLFRIKPFFERQFLRHHFPPRMDNTHHTIFFAVREYFFKRKSEKIYPPRGALISARPAAEYSMYEFSRTYVKNSAENAREKNLQPDENEDDAAQNACLAGKARPKFFSDKHAGKT